MNTGHFQVIGYSNVGWVGSSFDRRTTSRYCVLVGGNLSFEKVRSTML